MENTGEHQTGFAGAQYGSKRAEPRVPVPFIPVRIEDGPDGHPGVMLNISRGGALVQTPQNLNNHAYVKACFTLPGSETAIDCNASVRWSRCAYGSHVRVGLKFADMDPAAAEKIGSYIEGQAYPEAIEHTRAEPRLPTPSIPVIIYDGREYVNGVILDISRSGILIQTTTPVNAGAVVNASFFLPDTSMVVKCRARVVWQKNLYGVLANEGLEFIDIGLDSLRMIDDYIRNMSSRA